MISPNRGSKYIPCLFPSPLKRTYHAITWKSRENFNVVLSKIKEYQKIFLILDQQMTVLVTQAFKK